MFYVLVSLLTASLFAIYTNEYFDSRTLLPPARVEYGLWAIIGAGIGLAFVDTIRGRICASQRWAGKFFCYGIHCDNC